MQINFTFDQAASALPAGMVDALDEVAQYFDHLIANKITVNIEVGYGAITQDGQSSPVTSGAEGGPDSSDDLTYTQLRQDFQAHANSPDDRTALASLPASDPTGLNNFTISSAEEKAWGLISATDDSIDGSVGFQRDGADGTSYQFDPFGRASNSNAWDFFGVAEHEISHALGRVAGLDQYGDDSLLDLFRYSAPGQLQSNVTGSPAYFSIDGGKTNLDNFDTTDGDPGDWGSGAGNDANQAYGEIGVANTFGQTDLRELNILGFQRLAQTDDFEGKGTSDLIWRNVSTGAVAEWTFFNGQNTGAISLGAQPNYQILGSGDFNGDGTSDLLWRGASGDVWEWLMSNGQPTTQTQIGNASGLTPLIGDFVGAGTSDIVWQDPSTGVVSDWLMANGKHYGTIKLGAHPGWTPLVAGDFNGDGTTDMLWQKSTGQIIEWDMKNGAHTSSIALGVHAGWSVIGTGDFNGDGTTDVLWQNQSSGDVNEWLMGNGQHVKTVDLGDLPGWTFVASGDYYGTGTSDIVWQNASGATAEWAMLKGQHVASADVTLGNTSGLKGV